ncbi:MAG TPA: cytochrome c oxidase subunit 3 [Candidatus Megaira endosymbiont of Hartmannula sinica]|nr:cytochrome c oxidase subunit 3 [Candidatus Megaera endosymbiont of Hartmannula sinica]
MTKTKHHFHLVDPSPWPIAVSFSLLFLSLGIVFYIHSYPYGSYILSFGILCILLSVYGWWSDVIKEGLSRHHTKIVRKGLSIGMSLFILSEIMFFFAFFFSYFSASLFPVGIFDETGLWATKQGIWPPKGIILINPWDIPLVNTLILLLSGTTVTWAHYAINEYNKEDTKSALIITIILGFVFSLFQIYEYFHVSFGLKDGVYAANFYLATGFHGVHVFIGTMFLLICYIRLINGHFDKGKHHLGFEFAAWYWHFVDVIWIFLFIFIYVLN